MAEYRYTAGGKEYAIAILRKDEATWVAVVDDREYVLSLDERQSTRLDVRIAGRGYHCHVDTEGDDRYISWRGNSYVLRRIDHLSASSRASATTNETLFDPEIRAPMPGKVIRIHVSPGDQVEKNAPIVVLEAMKMEYTLTAPMAGVVECINCAVGDRVDLRDTLAVMRVPVEVVDE